MLGWISPWGQPIVCPLPGLFREEIRTQDVPLHLVMQISYLPAGLSLQYTQQKNPCILFSFNSASIY